MSLVLLMPCAGKSTRFNNSKPKYLLTHPNGNLMLIESIAGLDLTDVTRIVITVTKEHVETTKVDLEKIKAKILELKGIEPEFFVLDNFTSSQSETIYKTIIGLDIHDPIFIKDCDNYFNIKVSADNLICISHLSGNINAVNKSYVSVDKLGYLIGIVEKSVISDKFCVGGYSIKSSDMFVKAFDKIEKINGIDNREIYISHVIQQLLLDGELFGLTEVQSYHDWGTITDWIKYTQRFKTIFIDLDGVLVQNGSEYFQPVWGNSKPLLHNIKFINELYSSGTHTIIITTSRKSEYEAVTKQQLEEFGLKYHSIIFNLPHAGRILINDYSVTNPYPSSLSVCVKRDEDNLSDYLKY